MPCAIWVRDNEKINRQNNDVYNIYDDDISSLINIEIGTSFNLFYHNTNFIYIVIASSASAQRNKSLPMIYSILFRIGKLKFHAYTNYAI